MTAPARRKDAATLPLAFRSNSAHDLWQKAVQIRQEWLGHGLSTQPADRVTAERSLTGLYARISRPQPRFEWVDSPYQALPRVVGLPTLDLLYRWIRDPLPPGTPPLASDLAALASRLRGALGEGVVHADPELSPPRKGKHKEPWPTLPPAEALATGVPLGVVIHRGVREALHRSLASGFYLPVRAALAVDGPAPVCWYGQQDASWVAYYDALQRLGLARRQPDEISHFREWAALARSCGWWWPGEEVCVVVERPKIVHTDPVPGAWHDEVRLRHGGVEYRDGWSPRLR
ncbi:MAG: hypothetical protein GEU94_01630 [Micromonosporaceae bacterium]|nr:hypothetical protein [Micromonosporaceae bacterium]